VHRICFVEDDKVLLEGLVNTFASQQAFDVAGAFGSAEDALQQMDWNSVEVLVVDIELPGISGVDLVTRVALEHPELRIMVYTIAEDRPTVLAAIKRGATGYLLKGSSASVLVTAVRDLLAGGAPITPKIAREIIRELQPASTDAQVDEHRAETLLTRREQEILGWVAQGHSRDKIAALIGISAGTVHTHIKNIYAKLQAHNRTEAINRARDLGEI
jgi:DNA-binding NarL/FixJ family response regulator